jgi:predicted DNA-binding transcriptional regulator AlpA
MYTGRGLGMASQTEMLKLLTPEQVAEKLAVASARTLESWRARGQGPPFIRVGRLVRYRVVELDRWLTERTVGAAR